MDQTPIDVVLAILQSPRDLAHVRALVTDDFTYVSLNYDNPDLKRIMPWCGTSHGAESIVRTFTDVSRHWDVLSFDTGTVFGSGDNVAIFGRFTYRSIVLSTLVTSPFSVFATVRDGKCSAMQFMEDTFATAASFRSGGHWTFHGDPEGSPVTI
ncbi:nuclear transport factor 2 family protein [Lichenihabitans psoromatis]|uniref:nuclear transport factor 2 family protein n=1 Tax=Lichenihabitans psoromatis TaxID=2528642 RepID=UPI0010360CD2|nr:nuclear transport factor 2 family protein [Lichenihabitans psoromatis]